MAASALFITREERDAIRQATGGDMRLSGVRRHNGRGGARVNARYKLLGAGDKAVIDTTGPMPLIERDTAAHTVPKQMTKTRRRNRRQRKVLKFGGQYRRMVSHPGTKGKHTFERTWKAAAPESTKVFGKAMAAEIERGWRAG